ncbi:Sf6-type phage tail needle knob domain-containing protein [Escherichia coli]|nr:tail needle knob protein [Escherichia coli]
MADNSLNQPVILRAINLSAASIPIGWSPAYTQYILSQAADFTAVADKANNAGQGAYDAQVKNDQQDVQLLDHEIRLGNAEAQLQNHETRITSAEAAILSLDSRLTTAENDIDFLTDEVIDLQTDVTALQGDVVTLQTDVTALQGDVATLETDVDALQLSVADHETRIDALEYAVTRKKSEVVYTGLSLVIPTTPTNLVTLLKALTPTSGTLAPFFDTTTDKLKVYNENKTLNFKLSLIGSYPGGTTNRSMQLTFSGAVPDTLIASRNAATATDNVLLATFFSVDQGGFLATNGSTLTIQANGAAFTATTIKIIAEQ